MKVVFLRILKKTLETFKQESAVGLIMMFSLSETDITTFFIFERRALLCQKCMDTFELFRFFDAFLRLNIVLI